MRRPDEAARAAWLLREVKDKEMIREHQQANRRLFTRRSFLTGALAVTGGLAGSALLAACAVGPARVALAQVQTPAGQPPTGNPPAKPGGGAGGP
ncbi:MAG: hypothetical protein AB7P40_14410, partial [Chloroflexota bacterium]